MKTAVATQRINILFIVYPNMGGIMSRLMGARAGDYPYFEDAMSSMGANPSWGVLTETRSIENWLKGLKGKESRLYLSIDSNEPEDPPEWCGNSWHDSVDELIGKADKVLMITQDMGDFLYDNIGSEIGDTLTHDKILNDWCDTNDTMTSIESRHKDAHWFKIESFSSRKGVEIIYRETGIRFMPLPRPNRVNKRVHQKAKEAISRMVRPIMTTATDGPIPVRDVELFTRRFLIAISAHPAYEDRLPKLMAEWDRQIGDLPIQKALLFDGENPPETPDGWQVVNYEKPHGEPSPLRNQILELDVDWIQYWDADNTPSSDHLSIILEKAYWSGETVGLLYPNVVGDEFRVAVEPNTDPRRELFIDTASCWRKEAILSSGGWQSGMNAEDWALGRDMWSAGWKLEPSGVDFKWEATPGNRSEVKVGGIVVWESKDFAIVILLRGDYHFLECIKEDMGNLELPRHCGITVVTDGDQTFRCAVNEWLELDHRFERVTVIQARPSPLPVDDFMKIHARVGDLYNRAFRASPEEMILTWEDDVRPEPGAIRALSDQIGMNGNMAAVGAPYITRGSLDLAASMGRDWWDSPVMADAVGDEPFDVGMIAGGFTLWSKAALDECPMFGPMNVLHREGFLGWDGFLCKRINAAGWTIQLCGKSKVLHLPK